MDTNTYAYPRMYANTHSITYRQNIYHRLLFNVLMYNVLTYNKIIP